MKIVDKIRKFLYKYNLLLYYIFFADLILNETIYRFSCNPFGIILKLIRYFCYFMLLLKLIIDWKNGTKNITIVQIISFTVIFISFLITKNTSLILLFIILNAVTDKNILNIIKINYKIYFWLFFIIILLSLIGIIPDWVYYRGAIERHSLGFYYPTITMGIYLSIIIMFFYLNHDKVKYSELLILELINVFLYNYTDGRMSFYLITLILILLLVYKLKKLKKFLKIILHWKFTRIICMIVPLLLFSGTMVATFLYKNNTTVGNELNKVLSDRLSLNTKAFENYGVPLFGKKIDWNGWGGYGYTNLPSLDEYEYNYVDMSYTRIIFDYGIVITIIILVGYCLLLKKYYDEKKYWLVISIIFVLLWSCIEPNIVGLEKNIFVLYLSRLFNYGKIEKLDYKNVFKNKRSEL